MGSPSIAQRGSRTYSLNDGEVHYGDGGGDEVRGSSPQQQQDSQNRRGRRDGFSPRSADGGGSGGGFLRRYAEDEVDAFVAPSRPCRSVKRNLCLTSCILFPPAYTLQCDCGCKCRSDAPEG